MPKRKSRKNLNPYHLLCLTALLLSGCGLGMDSRDRLERGQQAYLAEEYRAAIIDAKNVLQEEPQNVDARLLLGRASIEIGDATSAEIELRRAVELGTDFADVAVDLGRALVLQQKYNEVIAEIDPDLIEDDAGRLLAMRMRGDSYLGLGQPSAARETFSTVLREDDENKEALLGIVQSYINERNLMQARQTLDQVLDVDANYVPAWIMSGSLYTQMRNVERAEGDYARAVDLANEASDSVAEMMALYGLADTRLNGGRHNEVPSTLARMNQISSEDPRTLIVAARFSAAEGDWADAQQHLQKVLQRAPDNRLAQMLLGTVHKESGNLEQAEMYLSAVVAGVPDNSAARRLLAETRLELNKTDEALEALAPLIGDDSADAGSLSMAATARLQMGEIKDATELLRRGIAANPGDSGLQLQLAFVHIQAGNSDAARNVLQNISASSSERTEYQRDTLLVLTQVAQGLLLEGQQNSEGIVSRWPDRAASHNLLGFVQMVSQDLSGARKSFNTAANLAPATTGPLWFLAQLDELENDLVSADRRYRAMLKLQPEEARAMVALAGLAARSENYDEARTWLENAINADEFAITPRKAFGSLLLALKDFASAERVAKDALDISDRDAELHNILGLAELNQKNYRNAETSFGTAVALDQGNTTYRLNLSRAQAGRGMDRAAIVTLEESVEQSLGHIPSGVMLATLKANSGVLDEARKIAARLVELHPDAAIPGVLEAELLVRAGDMRGASAAYDKALRIENSRRYAVRAYQIRKRAEIPDQVGPLVTYLQQRPLDTDVRTYLAQAYQSEGEISKANVQYETVLQSASDNFVAANNLAWNYFQEGDARAEAAARHAFEIQPENSSVVDTLGWILVGKGQHDDGVALLRNAVELGNGRAEIRYHLAAALARSDEPREAKEILQDILAEGQDSFASRQEAEELLSTL